MNVNPILSKKNMPLVYQKNEKGLFVCPHCDYTKSNQSSMHYHMKKHEEQMSHICKLCKKGFLQKQTLELHMRSRHPDHFTQTPNDNKFKCPFDNCNFTSLTKGNCIIHCLRIHYQEEMKEMMNVDPDTKIIECNDCGEEFHSSCSFYYHTKKCFDFKQTDTKYAKLQQIMNNE